MYVVSNMKGIPFLMQYNRYARTKTSLHVLLDTFLAICLVREILKSNILTRDFVNLAYEIKEN